MQYESDPDSDQTLLASDESARPQIRLGEEEIHTKRTKIGCERSPGRIGCPSNIKFEVLDGMEHSQSQIRAIARHDYDFDE